MWAKVNLFVAWFLITQIFLRNVLTIVGNWLLFALGMPAPLHEQFGWLAGSLICVTALFILRHVLGELPPGIGKPEGKGYVLGHRVLFASSLLALGVYVLPIVETEIQSELMRVTLVMFVTDFTYIAMAIFGVAISLIYQSAQPVVTNK